MPAFVVLGNKNFKHASMMATMFAFYSTEKHTHTNTIRK